jgi:hypothetical protein
VPVRPGDRVDVVGPQLDVPGATVVQMSDGAVVVVAVAEADAPSVARAVTDGQVSLILEP